MMSVALSTSEIIDKIYEAATLEDAVFWREEFIRRLAHAISRADLFDPASRDEINLYALAKGQSEQAVARLQMCIAQNDRWDWCTGAKAFVRA